MRIRIILTILILFFFQPSRLASSLSLSTGQRLNDYRSSRVEVRLFTGINPDMAIFTVKSGQYLITDSSEMSVNNYAGESVMIARYKKKIFLKRRNGAGYLCDTVYIKGQTAADGFSLRVTGSEFSRKSYSGDLKFFSDMDKLLIINSCDIEKYIAGVVKAEGGGGKNEEYFKTQAIIARTYTYRYYNKHLLDGYNLCDDTHCQVYNGLIGDSIIIKAVLDTKGLVITTPDSMLIISAFHSNCGGETSPSEYAWVTGQTYLKRVVDPYCQNSLNALWEKKLALKEWTKLLQLNGYSGSLENPTIFNFSQTSRVPDYSAGNFSIPLRTLRIKLVLKSSFFSVSVDGDSLLIKGRGYGHGVGLCQEGAINMALKGITCEAIINFYYSGVKIISIENVKKNQDDN
jgi:stage II sporulation protein D